MAPLIDVPPLNSCRGAFSIEVGKGIRRGFVLDEGPRDHMDLQSVPGPLRHGDGNRLRRTGADGAHDLRVAECRHIALLLKFEARLVDAAGGVDGEHERKVDVGVRPRERGSGEDQPAGQPTTDQ